MLLVSLMSLNKIACSEEKENSKQKLSLILRGGLRYISVGDINKHLEAYDNYFSEMTSYEGGKTKKLNNYRHTLEGELRLDVSSKFAIGVGIEYLSEKDESHFEFADPYPFYYDVENIHSISTKPDVSAVRLRLGYYYNIPLVRRINIFLNSGLDYYFSKASLYKYQKIEAGFIHIPESQWQKKDQYDVKTNGLGFHGGIGFEYTIANSLAIVLEFHGTYARIKNLTGKRVFSIYRDLSSQEGTDEGILYIGERDMTDEWYGENSPDLIISSSKPSGSEFRNIKEAVLDFSGFSLRLGIKIKLF